MGRSPRLAQLQPLYSVHFDNTTQKPSIPTNFKLCSPFHSPIITIIFPQVTTSISSCLTNPPSQSYSNTTTSSTATTQGCQFSSQNNHLHPCRALSAATTSNPYPREWRSCDHHTVDMHLISINRHHTTDKRHMRY